MIDSSVEEEDEAEDGSETEAPEDGADGQPQLDRASSNEPCLPEPTAAGGDQAESAQPAAPTSNTAAAPAIPLGPPRRAFSLAIPTSPPNHRPPPPPPATANQRSHDFESPPTTNLLPFLSFIYALTGGPYGNVRC